LENHASFSHGRVELPGVTDIKTELSPGKEFKERPQISSGPSDAFPLVHVLKKKKGTKLFPWLSRKDYVWMNYDWNPPIDNGQQEVHDKMLVRGQKPARRVERDELKIAQVELVERLHERR
jgi:hypothetical protein